MPSFYCPELNEHSDRIVLEGEEFHHLAHVLRHQSGDTVKLNSGKGWFATGTIQFIGKSQALIQPGDITFTPQSLHPYALAFSLLRSKNDEWLVEKLTELGVSELFPLQTEHSVRNPSANTSDRFRKTALSAIKQCDNPFLPPIHAILALEHAIPAILARGYQLAVASEQRPDAWLDSLKQEKPLCYFIGPEGGFSQQEFNLLAEAGVTEICLSHHILRAETAAIALASQHNLLHR